MKSTSENVVATATIIIFVYSRQRAENRKVWLKKFELYLIASGVAEKSETVQCATFLHIVGEEAIKVYNTFQFMEREKNKIVELKKKFNEYCELNKNMPYTRQIFFMRPQGPDETIDSYVTGFKHNAKDCQFGNLTDDLFSGLDCLPAEHRSKPTPLCHQ